MSVKKIFIILITAVVCVIVGAMVINILVPNVFKVGCNAIEQQIQRATGISIDINGDNNTDLRGDRNTTNSTGANGTVQGFQGGTGGGAGGTP